nr:hypothetical protein [Aureimonas sp. AU4]
MTYLTDDERQILAGYVKRARQAALEYTVGLRQTRRAADIRAKAATEILRLLRMWVDTVVLSTKDCETT